MEVNSQMVKQSMLQTDIAFPWFFKFTLFYSMTAYRFGTIWWCVNNDRINWIFLKNGSGAQMKTNCNKSQYKCSYSLQFMCRFRTHHCCDPHRGAAESGRGHKWTHRQPSPSHLCEDRKYVGIHHIKVNMSLWHSSQV